ncbi:MAG: recombinase family protein [Alphaproteobacteria bacterium]|nr:recombinase family protein [Rickettsiales bacterium]
MWTGKIPIGYKKIVENNKANFLPDEPMAIYIRKIFESYATGLESLKSLEEKCKAWNLVSPQSKTNQPICRNTVDRILQDPFYYGEMYIKKYDKYYPHNYEALINKWLFEKCKEVRTEKTTNQPRQTTQISTKKNFIFANLVKCKTTGKVVTCYDTTNRHGKTYIYLMAWNPEKKIYVREEKVLQQVKDVFKSMSVKNEDLINEMNEYLRKINNSEKEHHENEAKMLDKQIREIKQQESFWIDKYGNPNIPKSITEDIINNKLEELDTKKTKLIEKRAVRKVK